MVSIYQSWFSLAKITGLYEGFSAGRSALPDSKWLINSQIGGRVLINGVHTGSSGMLNVNHDDK